MSVGWVHHSLSPKCLGPAQAVTLPPAVCVKFLEDTLGQKLPKRPQPGRGEQLTVFQFWSYVEALDSTSMEAYVTETAEEGELRQWP